MAKSTFSSENHVNKEASRSSARSQVPLDIVLRVAHFLLDSQSLATLASLHRCSRETYAALLPHVFGRLDVRCGSSDDLLLLARMTDVSDLDDEIEQAVLDDTYFLPVNAGVRRLNALRCTRHLTLHALPSDVISQSFLVSASQLRSPIFPNLRSVALAPRAVDDIRTWIPATYDRPRNPPFLEGLARTSHPSHLCLAFRVVSSDDWEEHRDMTVSGQYQLVARINRLIEDGWADLKSLTVHDIVHQVLPSLPGCANTYHFSSHLLTTPQGPRFIPPGPKATYIAGPAYSFRAWQLGTAIKNLFPSGADSRAVLDERSGTSWTFTNLEGHVLTKLVRDDDDDSGVGWDEVGQLVKGCVKRGLPQDLPMREGFGRDLVDEVFGRIHYGPGAGQGCSGCGRSGQSHTTISRAQDIGD